LEEKKRYKFLFHLGPYFFYTIAGPIKVSLVTTNQFKENLVVKPGEILQKTATDVKAEGLN